MNRIMEQIGRVKADRRILHGIWVCYERRTESMLETLKDHHIDFTPSDFAETWRVVGQGVLKFPAHMQMAETALRDAAERRALRCKHPTWEPFLNVYPLNWQDWKEVLRKDRETGYVSYLVMTRESIGGAHLIKVELDLDTFLCETDLSGLRIE